MSLRRFLLTNRKGEADRSSLENIGAPISTYTSNVASAPSHTLSGSDTVGQRGETESSFTDVSTLDVAEKCRVEGPDYSKRVCFSSQFSFV